jgi:hypothetical protein
MEYKKMKKNALVCSGLVLCLLACNSQDSRYLQPCEGKYGSQTVIDNIQHQYHLEGAAIGFSEWYKEPARPPSNCDTIHLRIDARDSPVLSEDTFAVSVGHFFFNDSSNSTVKALYLEAIERWPGIGDVTIKY